MAGARASRQRRNANPAFLLSVRLRVLRLPFFGVAAVLLTAGVVNWLTGQINVAADVRTSVVEAVGVGVFLAPALFVLGVLWLLAGAGRPGPGALRRLSGILAPGGLRARDRRALRPVVGVRRGGARARDRRR